MTTCLRCSFQASPCLFSLGASVSAHNGMAPSAARTHGRRGPMACSHGEYGREGWRRGLSIPSGFPQSRATAWGMGRVLLPKRDIPMVGAVITPKSPPTSLCFVLA